MKRFPNEAVFVAQFLDPFVFRKMDGLSRMSAIDESCLIKILRHNKVAAKFERRLDCEGLFREKLFSSFKNLRAFYSELDFKMERDMKEFCRIKDIFNDNDIEFMLIKSDGSFPFESDNLDVLIRPEKLENAASLLKKAGYSELVQIREPHKFLFRNLSAYEVLPLHVHTVVEWEGTPFVDLRDLWRRSAISSSSNGFLIPSPEDCILITSAHLFFENHEIKLADVLKISSKIRNHRIDWCYMLDHAKRLHWEDSFVLTMLLLNRVHKDFYGQYMFRRDELEMIEETYHSHIELLKNIIRTCKYELPEIPYGVSVLFFLRRILLESNLSKTQRVKHVGWIASDILRRRIR